MYTAPRMIVALALFLNSASASKDAILCEEVRQAFPTNAEYDREHNLSLWTRFSSYCRNVDQRSKITQEDLACGEDVLKACFLSEESIIAQHYDQQVEILRANIIAQKANPDYIKKRLLTEDEDDSSSDDVLKSSEFLAATLAISYAFQHWFPTKGWQIYCQNNPESVQYQSKQEIIKCLTVDHINNAIREIFLYPDGENDPLVRDEITVEQNRAYHVVNNMILKFLEQESITPSLQETYARLINSDRITNIAIWSSEEMVYTEAIMRLINRGYRDDKAFDIICILSTNRIPRHRRDDCVRLPQQDHIVEEAPWRSEASSTDLGDAPSMGSFFFRSATDLPYGRRLMVTPVGIWAGAQLSALVPQDRHRQYSSLLVGDPSDQRPESPRPDPHP